MRRRSILILLGFALLLPAAWPTAGAAPVPPTWATYVGGPSWDGVDDVAIDPEGNAYVVGTTSYYGEEECCRDDTWVAKYSSSGQRLWRVDIGGPDSEHSLQIAYRAGVLAVSGFGRDSFPTTSGAWMTSPASASSDAFVMTLNPSTGAVRWATYVPSGVNALDVDDAGNVYAAGAAFCDLPTTPGAYQTFQADGCSGPADAYALKLAADGSRPVYLTYLGGRGGDSVDGIAVSPSSGSLLIAGWTTAADFDVTPGAYDTTHNGGMDVFVTKLDASGGRLLFSTLIGGPGDDNPSAIARDASSNPYVTGYTNNPGLPVTSGAHQTQFVGGDCGFSKAYRECYDVFVLKLDSSGSRLRYATYVATEYDEYAWDIGVDSAGAAYVVGSTSAPNFPSTDGWAMQDMDSSEAFALAVSPSGRTLLYSTVFPSSGGGNVAHGVAVRPDGAAYVAGDSSTFPVTPGAHDTTAESQEGFLARLGVPTQQLVFDHTGGHEWYVEVALGGRESDLVTKVEARDTGGAWATLPKQPYGKWAGGYHVEPGNAVEFRATLSNGAVRASCAFTHPGGNCTSAPPTNGTFDATFSGVKGNEWWVEAKVTGTEPLAKVEASVNGGTWKAMTLRSWGAWAASFNIPSGSIVQLRATSTSGATDLSGCYQWTAATPVACPGGGTPPPPGNSTFDATFKNVRGNEWWIETDVTVSGGTLAGVDARVNGGAWTALTKQSYGSWAKSIHAPAGSTVEFRARAADGSTDVSSAYRWPPA